MQEAGRRAFWSVNGPRIVQVGYEDEEDPKVMGAYEQLGSLVNTRYFILSTEKLLNLLHNPHLSVAFIMNHLHVTDSSFFIQLVNGSGMEEPSTETTE